MNSMFIEDPVVELKEVFHVSEANKLIQKGWLFIDQAYSTDTDGGDKISYPKILLALTKSAKEALSNKTNKSTMERASKPVFTFKEEI